MTHTNPTDKYIERVIEEFEQLAEQNPGLLQAPICKSWLRTTLQKHGTEEYKRGRSEALDEVLAVLLPKCDELADSIRAADKTPKYEYSGKGDDLNNRGEAAGSGQRWAMPWELAQQFPNKVRTLITNLKEGKQPRE